METPSSQPNVKEIAENIKQNRIIRYFKESQEELKKVSWPSRDQVINHTIVVISLSVAIALFLGSLDFGFGKIITFILSTR